MTEHVVADKDEIKNGERIIVEIEGREVGIFQIDNEYYAYVNWCAHQSGPCCEGRVTGTYEASYDRQNLEENLEYVREGEIINCPWHGFEYDIKTGDCLSKRDISLPSYPVKIKGQKIIVEV